MQLSEFRNQNWAKGPLAYLVTTNSAIVSRFQETLRYVSLDSENANTFSYEFASILRDACGAFGSFSDAIIRGSNPTKVWRPAPDINDFFDFYSQHLSGFEKLSVAVQVLPDAPRLQPFFHWSGSKSPGWWTAHNNLKHSEYKHARDGNLRNATHAVAAVEIMLRSVTVNQEGTELFSYVYGDSDLGQPGYHLRRLFEP